MDYLMNGQGFGSVAEMMLATNFNTDILRRFVGADGRAYMNATQVVNGELAEVAIPVNNATASLRKNDWIQLDEAIIRAAKPRLRFFGDIRSRGLTYSIPSGMAKTSLEYQTVGDTTPATISMDGMRQSQNDRPEFELKNMPLPIIHKDFQIPIRQLLASRQGGSPLDTTMAELSARRVAEEVEKLALGVSSTFSFGGSTIYGLTNFPSRNTKTLLIPTDGAWTPAKFVKECLDMKQKSQDDYHYGPWALYTSPAYDQYLDDDYSAAKGDLTLRQRVKQIEGITDVMTLDYLTGYQAILVQLTSDVVRDVVAMDMTTVQWESEGGMQLNFKVMCILLPQFRADFNGNCGIVHGATA